MKQDTKRIPYGRNDFVQIIEQNNYYVDKTMYLPALEDEAVNLFFIRPRRFGKSVFISMLQAYYDCNMKDKFRICSGIRGLARILLHFKANIWFSILIFRK